MTIEELKIKTSDLVKILKRAKKQRLAQCIEENWDKTAIAYSKELNLWVPQKPMEKELVLAFEKELERLEMEKGLKLKVLASLEKRRVLQTAPHLGVTEGPRMLCINWLGSLAVSEKEFYVVGMFSGIPFSNSFRPGRINRKNSSVNLFPSNLQDDLVYRSTIQEKLIESIKDLPAQINKFLPKALVGESYTKWALLTCQNIERKILQKENLVFLDINEVVSNYLVQTLKNRDHVFHKIFFEPKTREKFMRIFPNELMFYCSVMDGKYKKMENMIFSGKSLKSKSKKILLDNSEILIQEIKDGRVCPSLILTFIALSFFNQFKCFGSFAQVEYLPVYQKKLAKLKFMEEFNIKKIETANLTTGVFPEEINLYPADIIMNIDNQEFKQKEEILFGELLLPMKDKLIYGRQNKK